VLNLLGVLFLVAIADNVLTAAGRCLCSWWRRGAEGRRLWCRQVRSYWVAAVQVRRREGSAWRAYTQTAADLVVVFWPWSWRRSVEAILERWRRNGSGPTVG
jgi:hypothetical protein